MDWKARKKNSLIVRSYVRFNKQFRTFRRNFNLFYVNEQFLICIINSSDCGL